MAGWCVLPEEIILMISSYLELEDVLNCSSVCKRWRNVLNSSEKFWRDECSRKFFAENITRFDREFQKKALEKMTRLKDLTEFKDWRWKYIIENLLFSNWLEKGFMRQTLGSLQMIYPLMEHSCNGKFLAYPILRALKIMKLSNLTDHSLVNVRDMNLLYFAIVGSIFAYVQNHNVYIYQLGDSQFDLTHRTSIKQDLNFPMQFAFELHTPHPLPVFEHNEKHFVCVASVKCERRHQKVALLYIWDLEKNVKSLKYFKFSFSIRSFQVKLDIDTVWVVTSSQDQITLLRFDISTGRHKRILSLYRPSDLQIGSKYITIIETSTQNIYFRDKKTGKLCTTFKGNNDFSFIKMINYFPYCLFLFEELLGVVKIIDVEKFTEEKIYVSDIVTSAHFLIPKANLVLFGVGKSRQFNMQIWDIRKGVALKQLGPSLGIIYVSWDKIVFLNVHNQLEELNLDRNVELIKPEPKKREYFALKDTEEDDSEKF